MNDLICDILSIAAYLGWFLIGAAWQRRRTRKSLEKGQL